ncbi:MAG TPA: hypothetical protein VFK26_05210, partial [Gemmatimonadaceae bacterium]|nr:hypothetical protein [Gemmatimonadaceae bacterium]
MNSVFSRPGCPYRKTFCVGLFLVIFLSGCSTDLPSRPPGEPFHGVEAAPVGSARVYIFRPGFSSVSTEDSPRLLIDGKEVARLSVESYTNVIVKPGSYSLTLEPNSGESPIWSGSWQIRAEADQVYFLAVWNDIAYSHSSFPLLIRGPILDVHIAEAHDASLHFEPVEQSAALPVISTLTYLPGRVRVFEPKAP